MHVITPSYGFDGAGVLGGTAFPPLASIPDPTRNAESAKAWIGMFLDSVVRDDNLLVAWFNRVAAGAALGAASCAEVQAYNDAAITHYGSLQWVWGKLKPIADEAGVYMGRDVPVPPLIGTTINVTGSGKGGIGGNYKGLSVNVGCLASGMADRTKLQTLSSRGVASCMGDRVASVGPTSGDGGFAGVALVACTENPILCAGVLALTFALLAYTTDKITALVRSFTGSDIALINQQIASDFYANSAKRADASLNCKREQIAAIINTYGRNPTPDELKATTTQCDANAQKQFPGTGVPYATSWIDRLITGAVTIALVGVAVVAGYEGVKYLRERR